MPSFDSWMRWMRTRGYPYDERDTSICLHAGKRIFEVCLFVVSLTFEKRRTQMSSCLVDGRCSANASGRLRAILRSSLSWACWPMKPSEWCFFGHQLCWFQPWKCSSIELSGYITIVSRIISEDIYRIYIYYSYIIYNHNELVESYTNLSGVVTMASTHV